jgi:protein-S-isoprenylcysteine O-methyltransferase Ste14
LLPPYLIIKSTQMTAFQTSTYLWTIVAIIYFIKSVYVTKLAIAKEKNKSRFYYLICLVSGMGLIFYNDIPYGNLSDNIISQSPFFAWAGVLITVIGISFSLWARLIIGANWSGIVMIKRDHQLIQHGPYSITRHPSYSGFIVALAGTVITLNQWRGIIGFVILVLSFLWKISKEEQMLGKSFPEYEAYKKRTKKIIPFLY